MRAGHCFTGLAAAETVIRPGSGLRNVPLPHLVALKLCAGGTKSLWRARILRRPKADRATVLAQVLAAAGKEPSKAGTDLDRAAR